MCNLHGAIMVPIARFYSTPKRLVLLGGSTYVLLSFSLVYVLFFFPMFISISLFFKDSFQVQVFTLRCSLQNYVGNELSVIMLRFWMKVEWWPLSRDVGLLRWPLTINCFHMICNIYNAIEEIIYSLGYSPLLNAHCKSLR